MTQHILDITSADCVFAEEQESNRTNHSIDEEKISDISRKIISERSEHVTIITLALDGKQQSKLLRRYQPPPMNESGAINLSKQLFTSLYLSLKQKTRKQSKISPEREREYEYTTYISTHISRIHIIRRTYQLRAMNDQTHQGLSSQYQVNSINKMTTLNHFKSDAIILVPLI